MKAKDHAGDIREYLEANHPEFLKLFQGIRFSLWHGPTYTWSDLTEDELKNALKSEDLHVHPEHVGSIAWMWGDEAPERPNGNREAEEEHLTALAVVDKVCKELVDTLPENLSIGPGGVFASDKDAQEVWDDYVEHGAEFLMSEMTENGSYPDLADLSDEAKQSKAYEWASYGDGYEGVVLSKNEYLEAIDRDTGQYVTGRY